MTSLNAVIAIAIIGFLLVILGVQLHLPLPAGLMVIGLAVIALAAIMMLGIIANQK